MTTEQTITHNNKVAGSLFATAKLTGIIAVCLVFAGHGIVAGGLLAADALLLIASVVVCIRNMKLANSLEEPNAYSR